MGKKLKNKTKKTPAKKKSGLGAIYSVQTEGLRLPIMVITVAGLVGVAYYFLNRKVKYAQSKNAEDKSIDKGTAENIAKRIELAAGSTSWFLPDGTDEIAILKAISEIKTKKDYEAVEKAYSKLTGGKSLNEDLSKELSPDLLSQITEILDNKADALKGEAQDNSAAFAQQLKEAIEYSNFIYSVTTDIDGIFAVFRKIPDKKVYEKTKTAYKKLTGRELWVDLENEWNLKETPLTAGFWSLENDWSATAYIDKLKTEAIEKFTTL